MWQQHKNAKTSLLKCWIMLIMSVVIIFNGFLGHVKVVHVQNIAVDCRDTCRCLQGILGTINSGKSALVHRYLTGSYMQEESPEGMNYYLVGDSAYAFFYETSPEHWRQSVPRTEWIKCILLPLMFPFIRIYSWSLHLLTSAFHNFTASLEHFVS